MQVYYIKIQFQYRAIGGKFGHKRSEVKGQGAAPFYFTLDETLFNVICCRNSEREIL